MIGKTEWKTNSPAAEHTVYRSFLKMVNIAKFETLHNNLWDKHGEVEMFSSWSEDNKSAFDNNDCVPSEAQTEPCLLDRDLLSLC